MKSTNQPAIKQPNSGLTPIVSPGDRQLALISQSSVDNHS